MNQDSKSGQISYPKVNYGELLLPENDCKTSSAVNVPKNDQIFGHLETNQRPEPQDYFFFICPATYELTKIQKLVWTLNWGIFKAP